ncbi:hypothetical protein ABW20_dc0101520 [Dactylellina cionopaga]|nr:hypothetical protein ABW20_dc0101520 [Dactylellina cionopaga]
MPIHVVLLPLLFLTTPTLALFGKAKPAPKQTFFSKIFPILVLITVVTVIATILYLVYKTVLSLSSDVQTRLDNGGVKLSRTGADVKLKEVSYEKYRDMTQKVVVSAWNNSETKDFQSKLWKPKDKHSDVKKRNGFS